MMNGSELKEKLIEKAKELQIDKIGFASADPFLELKERLREQQELGFASGFEEKDITLRTHP
jgi:epoxyqueuosine reductase